MGPTGVGKTDRSVLLARRLGAPVVSVDRFQIFPELATGTGRPTSTELAGTQRYFLGERTVADGELTTAAAYSKFIRVVECLSRRHRRIVLEGGSISLLSLLFELGFMHRVRADVELMGVADWPSYRRRVSQRVVQFLAGSGERRSMLAELSQFWCKPEQLAFVQTIVGYDVLTQYCRRRGIGPDELMGKPLDSELVAALVQSHVDYAHQQTDVFEDALAAHAARTAPTHVPASRPRPAAAVGIGDTVMLKSLPIEFNPLAPAQLDNPYPVYGRLRRLAPVCYQASIDAWTVARYDDICEVLRDPSRFSAMGATKVKSALPEAVAAILARGIPYRRTLLDNDPPGHTRFRNLVSKVFVPQRIAQLAPIVYATAKSLIDGFCERDHIDVMRHLAFPLPIRVIASILGLPTEDLGLLKQWCDDWMALQSATAPPDRLVECAHNYLLLQDYFVDVVAQRRRAPRGDLLTALIEVQDDNEAPLDSHELVRLLMSLLIAGHETTTHGLGNTLALLLQHPEQLRALKENPLLAGQAVQEGLRLDPPVQSLFRRVVRDTAVGGVNLPAGARVMLLYASANRDEKYFPHADDFDIHRRSVARHLSFSRGAHFCLGSALAEMEIRTALELLVTRLPNMRLADAQPSTRVEHFFLRGYGRLPIAWDAQGLGPSTPEAGGH